MDVGLKFIVMGDIKDCMFCDFLVEGVCGGKKRFNQRDPRSGALPRA